MSCKFLWMKSPETLSTISFVGAKLSPAIKFPSERSSVWKNFILRIFLSLKKFVLENFILGIFPSLKKFVLENLILETFPSLKKFHPGEFNLGNFSILEN